MKKFIVYEVTRLNIFNDDKLHLSYKLIGEFESRRAARKAIAVLRQTDPFKKLYQIVAA